MTTEEKLAALEKLNRKLETENRLLTETLSTLQTGMIQSAIRASAQDAGIRESAIDDALSPHWWGESKDATTKAATKNPWTRQYWNKTEQGRIVREFGEAKANQMAEAAGVRIDALRPATA